MTNIFLMPEKYKDLNQDELINAFFGTYYELLITVNDNMLTESIVDYVKNSIKNINDSNDIVWKHMWLSFCNFIMHRMKYYFFCECIKRERTRVATTHDLDFIRFIGIINIASKELTRHDAMFEAPRFTSALYGDNAYNEEFERISTFKNAIADCIERYKNTLILKSDYLNKNQYFDYVVFVADAATMVSLGFGLNPTMLQTCICSVVNPDDTSKLTSFCEEICSIIKTK